MTAICFIVFLVVVSRMLSEAARRLEVVERRARELAADQHAESDRRLGPARRAERSWASVASKVGRNSGRGRFGNR